MPGVAGLLLLGLAACAGAGADMLDDVGARAADAGVSSSLRLGYWRSSRTVDGRENLAPATLWLRERHTFDAGPSVVAEGWLESVDLSRASNPETELREFYLRDEIGGFDIRIGRQIVAWGRADRINPTDNLTSRDLSRTFPDDDDLRRGSGMLRVSHPLGDGLDVQAYWIPEFRPEVHPLAERIGPFTLVGDKHPDNIGQGALKLDGSQGGFDWSVSYFDGYDPSGDLRASDARRRFELVRTYARNRTVGADLATVRWGFNLRAEAAYTDFPERERDDLSKQPFFFAVIGGDRNLGEQFNVNVQYIVRHVTNHRSPDEDIVNPYLRGIALINAIEGGQRDEVQNGASVRMAWTRPDQLLRAEVFGIEDFTHHDGVLRALVRYEATDTLRVSVGYEWNHGESDSLFGSRRVNNGAFLELRLGY